MFRQSRKRKRNYRNSSTKGTTNKSNARGNPSPEANEECLQQLQTASSSTVERDKKFLIPNKNTIPTAGVLDLDSELGDTSGVSASTSGVLSVDQSACSSPKRYRRNSKPYRSMSPARFYREREQSELQNLNDRLSSHLDTVKRLQSENSSLKLQLKGMEVFRMQAENRKHFHDVEALQELLDTARQENSRLDQALHCARKERENLSQSLTEKEEDIALLEIQVQNLKCLSQQHDKQQSELKCLREELKEKEADAKRLSEELVSEKVARQRVMEELELKQSRYIEEIQETSIRMNTHIETTDQKLEAGYEELVNDALSGIREQNVRELAAVKEELTTVYQSKLNDWKSKAERSNADLLSTKKELKAAKTDSDQLRSQMTRVKMDSAALKVQVEEEQAKHHKLKDDSEKEVCQMQREMVLLKQELSEVKEELEEMGGANMRLEQEINTYRVLLEDLETKSPFTKNDKTPNKQDKNDDPDNETSIQCPSLTTFLRTNQVDNGVKIESVDTAGRYMTIFNGTDHLVDMCLWMVKQSTSRQTTMFEIPFSTPLMSEQRLVIWSEGEGPFADKPSSDDILSLPDDLETQEFYGIDLGMDREGNRKRPVIDAIHITLSGKKWMSRPSAMNMRLEDGDGQLQSKSDFTIHKHKINEGSNARGSPHNIKQPEETNSVTPGTTNFVKPSSSSGSRKRPNRSQSVGRGGKRVGTTEHGAGDKESSSRQALDWHGTTGKRKRLHVQETDENGNNTLHKDGCHVM